MSESVAASREQSAKAEPGKGLCEVTLSFAVLARRWGAGAFLPDELKKRGLIKEPANGVQKILNCHRAGLLLPSSESF